MKILHVIPFLWSGAGGVVTRLCEDQACTHEVRIVTSGRIGQLSDWLPYRRRLRAVGVSWARVNLFKREPEVMWDQVHRLAAEIAGFRPDIVHAHAGVPTLAASLARGRCARHFSLVAHMYNWTPGRPGWMNAMDLLGFGGADRVLCSARRYERLFLDAGIRRDRLVYLPWGVDVAAPAQIVQWKASLPLEPLVGFVGRLEPRKDQLGLIDSVLRARRSIPGLRLELVGPDGDVDYAHAVRARAREDGVRGCVSVLGAVKFPAAVMRHWSVFVSASRDEGQGLAVAEAMGMGLPVVVRACAGLEDFVVHERTGLVATGSGPALLARMMVKAVREPVLSEKRARAAYAFARKRLDWSVLTQRIEALYEALRR